jgi:hypothetical protein
LAVNTHSAEEKSQVSSVQSTPSSQKFATEVQSSIISLTTIILPVTVLGMGSAPAVEATTPVKVT